MNRLLASLVILTTAFVIAISASGCWMPVRTPIQVQLSPEVAQAALEAAQTRVGDPYVWGGQSPGGFDCSGLVICLVLSITLLPALHVLIPDFRRSIGGKQGLTREEVQG